MAVAIESKYQWVEEGPWGLWVRAGGWNPSLWTEVLARLELTRWSDHPQTIRFRYPAGEAGTEYYLKVYHRPSFPGLFKDLFRDSKAFRALKQGESLSEMGFHAPLALAAGEERTSRLLERAFLLTVGIQGISLPLFLRELCPLLPGRASVQKKRAYLKQLALEIRRMHEEGFVHGDLIPSNILVHVEGERIAFYTIDHDRTRRYPFWCPQRLWKRNLVQLNRFVLDGISLQDRMRFLKFYLNSRSWGKKERRFLLWLEMKTRKRRRECDRVEAAVSFRELMRWNGPFAPDHSQAER